MRMGSDVVGLGWPEVVFAWVGAAVSVSDGAAGVGSCAGLVGSGAGAGVSCAVLLELGAGAGAEQLQIREQSKKTVAAVAIVFLMAVFMVTGTVTELLHNGDGRRNLICP